MITTTAEILTVNHPFGAIPWIQLRDGNNATQQMKYAAKMLRVQMLKLSGKPRRQSSQQIKRDLRKKKLNMQKTKRNGTKSKLNLLQFLHHQKPMLQKLN